jgi:hypothetical protein
MAYHILRLCDSSLLVQPITGGWPNSTSTMASLDKQLWKSFVARETCRLVALRLYMTQTFYQGPVFRCPNETLAATELGKQGSCLLVTGHCQTRWATAWDGNHSISTKLGNGTAGILVNSSRSTCMASTWPVLLRLGQVHVRSITWSYCSVPSTQRFSIASADRSRPTTAERRMKKEARLSTMHELTGMWCVMAPGPTALALVDRTILPEQGFQVGLDLG